MKEKRGIKSIVYKNGLVKRKGMRTKNHLKIEANVNSANATVIKMSNIDNMRVSDCEVEFMDDERDFGPFESSVNLKKKPQSRVLYSQVDVSFVPYKEPIICSLNEERNAIVSMKRRMKSLVERMPKTNNEAVTSDLIKVGGDIRAAIRRYEREIAEKRRGSSTGNIRTF